MRARMEISMINRPGIHKILLLFAARFGKSCYSDMFNLNTFRYFPDTRVCFPNRLILYDFLCFFRMGEYWHNYCMYDNGDNNKVSRIRICEFLICSDFDIRIFA